jgi:Leucine-rich repeat (LRR) protein
MLRQLLPGIICVWFIALTACESYDFKVNDKVVYSPPPLFTNFEAPDAALHTCLEQAIIDDTVSAADQLSNLNCSHAGIEDLGGLSTFTAMTTLRLSSNQVRNLVEVGAISTLEELYLDNNLVIDPVPLYQLQALHFVDLSGNPKLQCPSREGFARVETVILPAHCR